MITKEKLERWLSAAEVTGVGVSLGFTETVEVLRLAMRSFDSERDAALANYVRDLVDRNKPDGYIGNYVRTKVEEEESP